MSPHLNCIELLPCVKPINIWWRYGQEFRA